ncbi:hypothetical protein [Halobellus rufus]|uniref:hypothetical protein n=1 Tax=Halobellus rufus TaxID=1448860 RepID=UPI0006797CD8|nr:hypothetical protein [Halobellus rufus]
MSESRFELEHTPLPEDVLVEEEFIEMRDGIELRSRVFRLDTDGEFPVVTTMTPYVSDVNDQWEQFTDIPG